MRSRVFAHLFGRLYDLLYRFRELYENRFEATVALIEIVLIGFGLVSTVTRVLFPRSDDEAMSTGEMVRQSMEAVIFFLLLILSSSRFVVAMRKGRLGYGYEQAAALLEDRDPVKTRQFFDGLRAVPIGGAPGWPPGDPEVLQQAASLVAHRTASLLSIRVWRRRDERWRAREQRALADWFNDFGATLWRIERAAKDGASSPSSYYSVVVPMTPRSAQSIRSGFRSTDMAEIDPGVVSAFALEVRPSKLPVNRVDFIAYLHLHFANEDEPPDDAWLLAASAQHLAFLLFGLFGADADFDRRWNFTVLCESSNARMSTVLRSLGFLPLLRESEDAPQQKFEARSFAGFELFELRIDGGRSVDSDAHAFLNLLKQLVRSNAARIPGG